MPLTFDQIKWLENQEKIKKAIAAEEAKAKLEAELKKLKAAKSKAAADSAGGDAKVAKKVASAKVGLVKRGPQSAVYAPFFGSEAGKTEADGPMRQRELEECESIEAAFRKYNSPTEDQMRVLSARIRRTLITPQDRPECLSRFNVRTATDGLRTNPAPVECWRKLAKKKGGKGAKSKKNK